MNDLSTLSSRLQRLRLVRVALAWIGGMSALLATLVATLFVALLLDIALKMGSLERRIVLALWGGVAFWGILRYILPVWRQRESLVQLAMTVERHEGIASDLVAAIQFSDHQRQQYGSEELRTAVVETTAEAAPTINYPTGIAWQDWFRRVLCCTAAIATVALSAILFPGHMKAFASRFLLADTQYPTRTVIRVVAPPAHVAYGQPLVFRVEATGEIPTEGEVRLTGLSSGMATVVALQPTQSKTETVEFTGQIDRMLEDVTYEVELGDARTMPTTVHVIPLPKATVELNVTPPEYAAARLATEATSARNNSALVGSRVVPIVTADKELHRAAIGIGDQVIPLEKSGNTFTLTATNTSLSVLDRTLRYEIQVEDKDGLRLDRPLSGVLHLREDFPPRIAAATATREVLPDARPTIRVAASDDFGLERIVLHQIILRNNSTTGEPDDLPPQEIVKSADRQTVVDHTFRLDLARLKLLPGDRVVCSFDAYDYRGRFEPKSTRSESVAFEVVDRATIMSTLRDVEIRMDEKLDAIIKRQSDIGDR